VLQVVTGFRVKVVLLAVFILVLHTASFAALMGLVRVQVSYKTDMGAAGEVADALHRVLTYATVLEAAQRGYGFTQTDIPLLAAEMRASIDRWAHAETCVCKSCIVVSALVAHPDACKHPHKLHPGHSAVKHCLGSAAATSSHADS
jgi:hypothetical protein